MERNHPQIISDAEWKEIVEVREVREAWGLGESVSADKFKATVYGVKFDFYSGGPGYVGDLFILQGDALGEPVLLIRRDGILTLA